VFLGLLNEGYFCRHEKFNGQSIKTRDLQRNILRLLLSFLEKFQHAKGKRYSKFKSWGRPDILEGYRVSSFKFPVSSVDRAMIFPEVAHQIVPKTFSYKLYLS